MSIIQEIVSNLNPLLVYKPEFTFTFKTIYDLKIKIVDKIGNVVYNINRKRLDLKRLCQESSYFTITVFAEAVIVLLWETISLK